MPNQAESLDSFALGLSFRTTTLSRSSAVVGWVLFTRPKTLACIEMLR